MVTTGIPFSFSSQFTHKWTTGLWPAGERKSGIAQPLVEQGLLVKT